MHEGLEVSGTHTAADAAIEAQIPPSCFQFTTIAIAEVHHWFQAAVTAAACCPAAVVCPTACCVCAALVQVGWEETTEAAMAQLLRSHLARSQKDAAAVLPALAPAADTARVQKHVSLVVERLSKGMRLLPACC